MRDEKKNSVTFSVRNFGFNKLETVRSSLRSFRHSVYCKQKMRIMGVGDWRKLRQKTHFFVSWKRFGNSEALWRPQVASNMLRQWRTRTATTTRGRPFASCLRLAIYKQAVDYIPRSLDRQHPLLEVCVYSKSQCR